MREVKKKQSTYFQPRKKSTILIIGGSSFSFIPLLKNLITFFAFNVSMIVEYKVALPELFRDGDWYSM